ncbi:BON domain-containing protein [Roseateles cellulosilyticus]|uniref:BON domain-containing protein n=1 Tax=Pelomonas cellulosilytica TaxID=2906762 RepID=A0ABS8Y081_9BURK|nr:BON domain-containing protein [Pelomonas sp. P8]MCE4556296.1 BON domain-containing protein [Pelomonas sp. P8]
MKFPKSLHADGWADHIDTTPVERKPGATKVAGSPLRPMKPAAAMGMNTPRATSVLSTTPPVADMATPRAEPRPTLADRPQPQATHAAALPPRREVDRLSWMIAAGAGAALIAGVAVWSMNRSSDAPTTPPATVTGSVEPQAQVAAATPVPDEAASQAVAQPADAATPPPVTEPATATTTAAAEPAPAPTRERLGPPVTTVKPAVEPRQVARADVPAPRPDLVTRANPRGDTAQVPERTPYLQPVPAPTVATAPTAIDTPAAMPDATTGVPAGNAPITMPPTAAGPSTSATPPVTEATPPVVASQQAAASPDTQTPPVALPQAAPSTSPGTPPLAQAPQQPAADDGGITVKVRSALAADSTLAAVPIAVSTDHGVVRLEGQAPDAPTRERATVVAASTMGVKAVDNRLVVPATQVSQAPTGL